MTGIEEDKAEVFATLIVQPEYVTQRTDKDQVLAAKVTRMKDILRHFCPEACEALWENANAVDRTY